jgi:hypothetical protein
METGGPDYDAIAILNRSAKRKGKTGSFKQFQTAEKSRGSG